MHHDSLAGDAPVPVNAEGDARAFKCIVIFFCHSLYQVSHITYSNAGHIFVARTVHDVKGW